MNSHKKTPSSKSRRFNEDEDISNSSSSSGRPPAKTPTTTIRLQPSVPPDPELEMLYARRRQINEYLDSINYYGSPRIMNLRFNLHRLGWDFRNLFRTDPYSLKPKSVPSSSLPEPDKNQNYGSQKEPRPSTSKSSGLPFDLLAEPPLSPRRSAARDFIVYTLLGGIKTYLFGQAEHGQRRHAGHDRHVRFENEIEQQAVAMGDRAGKDRVVRRSKNFKPRRRKHRSKFDSKRRKKVVDPELGEDVAPAPAEGCFQSFMSRILFGANDIADAEDPTSDKTGLSAGYNKAMNLFANNIELAGEFVDGNITTLKSAEKYFHFPQSSEVTDNLNYIAGEIWMFAFGIHDLFKADTDQIPTRSEFESLVNNFGILAEVTDAVAAKMLRYSSIHSQHSREWLSTVQNMGKKLFRLKLEPVSLKQPKRGKTLHINKPPSEPNVKSEKLRIVARDKTETPLRWSRFNNFPKELRLLALADLLDNCSDAINRIETQVRFFVDDMENQKFEEEDLSFITRLYLIDDLLKFFIKSKETTQEHRQRLHFCMANFAYDLHDLIVRGQKFIEKVAEINDMIQLCYDYMKSEYAVNLNTDLNESAIHSKRTQQSQIFKVKCCRKCLASRLPEFHYKPAEFYRTDFKDAFKAQSLSLSHVELKLKPAHWKSSEDIAIRFATSFSAGEGTKFEDEHAWTVEPQSDGMPRIEKGIFINVLKSSSGTGVDEVDEVSTTKPSILKKVSHADGGSLLSIISLPEDELRNGTIQNVSKKEDVKAEIIVRTDEIFKKSTVVRIKNPNAPNLEDIVENDAPKIENVTKVENVAKTDTVAKKEGVTKPAKVTKTENASKKDDVTKTENIPKTEDVAKPENVPKTENIPKKEDVAKTENVLKTDNVPKKDDIAKPENVPKPEIVPKKEDIGKSENVKKDVPKPDEIPKLPKPPAPANDKDNEDHS